MNGKGVRKMEISIYQINIERDNDRVAFLDVESMNALKGFDKPDSSIYDAVYSGEVDCSSLEDVYRMFNLDHPSGYRGRSLSVSDIVEVKSAEMLNPVSTSVIMSASKVEFTPPKMPEKKQESAFG